MNKRLISPQHHPLSIENFSSDSEEISEKNEIASDDVCYLGKRVKYHKMPTLNRLNQQ